MAPMTAYEIISIFIGILALLMSFGSLVIALLAFLDKMGSLFDFRNGLSKGKDFFGSGIPFIRYTDVYNNRFLKGEVESLHCTVYVNEATAF